MTTIRQALPTFYVQALILALSLFSAKVLAVEPDSPWPDVLADAQGQTVYFNAWGGSDRINRYLQWVAQEVKKDFGITLEHVKVGDIAEIVGQLEAASLAGRDSNGNVDLMWVNGENFAALKSSGLLWGPFADNLPNNALIKQSPSIALDFSVPVEGLESAWGGAQLVFIHDSAITQQPPTSATALLDFVIDGGRFSYPAPPAFHGTTMIKQLLIELLAVDALPVEQVGIEISATPCPACAVLAAPVVEENFEALTAPLWEYLDTLHPHLRGGGKTWPTSGEMTRQLLDDGELDIAISFNPNEATAAVKNDQLPDTVRTYVFDNGTIGNTHFVTIPWNAAAKAGAMVVANFLQSPEAHARKADPAYWGDPTVLDMQTLSDEQRALFEAVDVGVWALPIGAGSVLPEPHASWASALEQAWIERYGQ